MKNVIKFITKNYRIIFSILFLLLIMLLMNQCRVSRKLRRTIEIEKLKAQQNMSALNDTVSFYKNKNGDESFAKAIAIMSKKELKEKYPDLYESLNNEFGEVKYITQYEIIYKDTGSVKNIVSKLSKDHYSLYSEYHSLVVAYV